MFTVVSTCASLALLCFLGILGYFYNENAQMVVLHNRSARLQNELRRIGSLWVIGLMTASVVLVPVSFSAMLYFVNVFECRAEILPVILAQGETAADSILFNSFLLPSQLVINCLWCTIILFVHMLFLLASAGAIWVNTNIEIKRGELPGGDASELDKRDEALKEALKNWVGQKFQQKKK